MAAVATPSVFDPAGPIAAALADASWALLGGGVLIAAAVTAVALHALHQPRRAIRERRWIVVGGVVMPVCVVAAIFVLAHGSPRSPHGADVDGVEISVTAHMWWWELRYRDTRLVGGERRIAGANELWIPTGRPVRVALTTQDVIHSFWVPQLAGKVDMVPGRITHVVLLADREGVYRGQCAEFCGTAHARMALHVIAVSAERFDAWREQQAQAAADPDDDDARRGREVFRNAGCAVCHAIRGVSHAERGPDLTHVAGRRWLAAGALDHRDGALRRWLTETQHLKPGARMPAYAHLAAGDLDDLIAYLEQLR